MTPQELDIVRKAFLITISEVAPHLPIVLRETLIKSASMRIRHQLRSARIVGLVEETEVLNS